MELHMHSHRWTHRAPDWTVAAVSGFAAGAILMVMEMLWSTFSATNNPWTVSHGIAAITMGPDVLHQGGGGFNMWIVGMALITHYVLGVCFGMILAAIVAPFRLDSSQGMVLLSGAVFGLLLYAFNFYFMEQLFPWFAAMRGWETIAAHLIFGMSAGWLYWVIEPRI